MDLSNILYESILYESISNEICKIDPNGIYALSFFVYDDCDDPEWSTVTLGFNTNKQVQDMIKTGHPEDLRDIEEIDRRRFLCQEQ